MVLVEDDSMSDSIQSVGLLVSTFEMAVMMRLRDLKTRGSATFGHVEKFFSLEKKTFIMTKWSFMVYSSSRIWQTLGFGRWDGFLSGRSGATAGGKPMCLVLNSSKSLEHVRQLQKVCT